MKRHRVSQTSESKTTCGRQIVEVNIDQTGNGYGFSPSKKQSYLLTTDYDQATCHGCRNGVGRNRARPVTRMGTQLLINVLAEVK